VKEGRKTTDRGETMVNSTELFAGTATHKNGSIELTIDHWLHMTSNPLESYFLMGIYFPIVLNYVQYLSLL